MIYTLQEGQNFDPEILRQDLVAALDTDQGWHINTAGNQVDVVFEYDNPSEAVIGIVTTTILAHFANGATRESNKAILKQIADLEATQTPRRIREGGQWLADLEAQIAALRVQLK